MVGLCIPRPQDENIRAHWDHVQANFLPTNLYLFGEDDLPEGIPLVLLQPDNGRFLRGSTSLEKFDHPEDAIYIFGPDWTFLQPHHIPEPDHFVYIPTDTQRDMFSFVAYAVAMWDRRMKAE